MNKRILFQALLFSGIFSAVRAEEPGVESAPAAQDKTESAALKDDFQAYAVGKAPDELFVVEGEFTIQADGEKNKVLQLAETPVLDGGVLFGKAMKGGSIKLRVKAESKRRLHPRFAIGLGGVAGYRLRLVPAEKVVEITKEEERVQMVEFPEYKSDTWTWMEFSSKAEGEGTLLEGRIWADGSERPGQPTLTLKVEKPPANGKASAWGAPYSEKPIWFDDVEVISP